MAAVQPGDRESEGDLAELCAFAFREAVDPGLVMVEELATPDPARKFRFLCDLYIAAARFHNDLGPDDPMDDLAALRKSTIPFLRERMMRAFQVEPVVEMVDPEPVEPEPEPIDPTLWGPAMWMAMHRRPFTLARKHLHLGAGWTDSHMVDRRLGIKLAFKEGPVHDFAANIQ